MNRGARKAPIFTDDRDCLLFLATLGEAVEQFGVEVHAYALMPNHFHLLVRSPLGNVSRGMRHLLGVFSQRMNRHHAWDGPLFRGRFKSQLVHDETYLRVLVAYIHLNPVQAHLVTEPGQECWTSHRAYMGLESTPPWLSTDRVLDFFGSAPQLATFTQDLHRGREPWPEDVSRDDGWQVAAQGEPAGLRADIGGAPGVPAETPREFLTRIAAATGLAIEQLRTPALGRGAGPERRFAVVALARRPDTSHGQVAELLNMTRKQVANVVYRARHGATPAIFQTWSDSLKRPEKAEAFDEAPPGE